MELNSFAQRLPTFSDISECLLQNGCLLYPTVNFNVFSVQIQTIHVNTLLIHADCFTCKTDGDVQFLSLFSASSAAAAENDTYVNEPSRHWPRVLGKLNVTKLYLFKHVV